MRARAPGANWSRRLAVFAVVLLVEALLARRFGVIDDPALLGVIVASASFGLTAVLLAVRALVVVWDRAEAGGGRAFSGLLFGALALLPFAAVVAALSALPPAEDLSTSPDDPPAYLRSEWLVPGLHSAVLDDPGPSFSTLPATDLYNIGRIAGDRLGWRLVASREPAGERDMAVLQFEGRVPVIGVPVDLVARLAPEGARLRLDVRSGLRRVGHDLGLNAFMIRRYLAAFEEAAATPELAGD